MRKSLSLLTACAVAVLIAAATAIAATPSSKVSTYRAAALKCAHGRNLEAKLTGASIGFLRSTFVPCVVKVLHGNKAYKTSTALTNQVAHDARAFVSAKSASAASENTTSTNQFNRSGSALCSSTSGDWAWATADNTPSPALTYIVLAKQLYQAFFATSPKLGANANATFGFAFVHNVFFHEGKVKSPLGIAAFVLVC